MLELPDQVYIPDYPEAVEDVTVSYDEGTEQMSVDFTMPSGAVSVAMYSNYDKMTGTYEPYVQEDVPLEVLTGASDVNLPPGQLQACKCFWSHASGL